MTYISLAEGVSTSIISIIVVFLILFLLQIVISMFKYIFPQQKPAAPAKPTGTAQAAPQAALPEDEESRTVAMLTALMLASEEKDGRHYEIESVKRIK